MRPKWIASPIMMVLYLMLPNGAAAQTQNGTVIRFAVEENNRLFLKGDGGRYVEDLHLYLRCAARKDGKYIGGRDPVCEHYRKRANGSPVEVPNLRTGLPDKEYLVRYDKVMLAHPTGYVTDSRRSVRFYLSEEWLKSNAGKVTTCHWTFKTARGASEVTSPNCIPVLHDVDLVLSSDGKQFSWQADVRLALDLAGGSKLIFVDNVVVRDFLIVAMGDSFTSGEGNPERNYTRSIPAQWLDYRCHRSVFSYPVIAATALALADPRHSVTVVHVACSGAQSTEGILQGYAGVISTGQAYRLWHRPWWRQRLVPQHWKRYGTEVPTLPSQIEQVSRLLSQQEGGAQRKPDLLLMSIGVNDVGFSDLLHKLATERCGARCFAELRSRRADKAAHCNDDSKEMRINRSFECLKRRLVKMRETIDKKMAPQRAYLMEYIDPLRDEKNLICTNGPVHKKRLLNGVLGPLQGVVGLVKPIELTKEEFQFADVEFYTPLKQVLVQTATVPGWAIPPPIEVHERKKRGFCASPSWYHTYVESKHRQASSPGKRFESTGTLHPNGFGHFYAALRVLAQLRKENHLAGHNINLMDGSEFDPKDRNIVRPDGSGGFAFYLQDKHKPSERIEKYYKF